MEKHPACSASCTAHTFLSHTLSHRPGASPSPKSDQPMYGGRSHRGKILAHAHFSCSIDLGATRPPPGTRKPTLHISASRTSTLHPNIHSHSSDRNSTPLEQNKQLFDGGQNMFFFPAKSLICVCVQAFQQMFHCSGNRT